MLQTDNHTSSLNFYNRMLFLTPTNTVKALKVFGTSGKGKGKRSIAVHNTSHPYGNSRAMGSHNVTCHPTEVIFLPLSHSKLVLELATQKGNFEGCKAELVHVRPQVTSFTLLNVRWVGSRVLACWTQEQKGLGSNHSCDAVG